MRRLPLIIGVVLGAALFAIALLVPASRLDSLIAPTGLARAIPQAAPPLGLTARLVIGAIGFLLAAGVGWLLSRGSAGEDAVGDEAPARGALDGPRGYPAVRPPAPARDWTMPSKPAAPAAAGLPVSATAATAATGAPAAMAAMAAERDARPTPTGAPAMAVGAGPAEQPARADFRTPEPPPPAAPIAPADRSGSPNDALDRLSERLTATEERLAAQMAQVAQQLAEIAATTRQIARTPPAAAPPQLAPPRIRAADLGSGERRVRIARAARDLRAALPSIDG